MRSRFGCHVEACWRPLENEADCVNGRIGCVTVVECVHLSWLASVFDEKTLPWDLLLNSKKLSYDIYRWICE